MEPSLLTPKCTLVPSDFFDPATAREALSSVVTLDSSDTVKSVEVKSYGAVLIYSDSSDIPGSDLLPEMFFILRDLPKCPEYNKILCTWTDGLLFMAVAQGGSLLLSNVWQAPDFTTAQYFIFLSLKTLQLNPEVSTICWRSGLEPEEEMSLYRYFKAVEQL